MQLTLPQIDALYTRQTTVKEVAETLNMRPNTLSLTLRRNGFRIPDSDKVAQRAKNSFERKQRTTYLTDLATQVQAKNLTLTQAATHAKCHPRTILRHVPR
jgi:IS30 family transposase